MPSCCRTLLVRQQAAVLRPRAQHSQDARDQDPRVSRFADEIVVSGEDGVPALPSRRRGFRDADEYALAEPRLSPHTRGGNRYTDWFAQNEDDDLMFKHDLIGGPHRHVDHAETPGFERLTVGCFAASTIDDEH